MNNLKNFLYNNITQYYFSSLLILLSFILSYFIPFDKNDFYIWTFFICLIVIFLFKDVFSYLKLISYGLVIGIICFHFKYTFFLFIFFVNFIFILFTPIYLLFYRKIKNIFINIFYFLFVFIFCFFYNTISNVSINDYIYHYLSSIILPLYIIFSFQKNRDKIVDIRNFNFLFLKYF